MRQTLLATSFLAGLLTACTSVKHDATVVKVTQNSADAAGYKILGMVEATSRRYLSPEDQWMKRMQDKVARLGGNVMLVPTYNATGTGTVYLCGSNQRERE